MSPRALGRQSVSSKLVVMMHDQRLYHVRKLPGRQACHRCFVFSFAVESWWRRRSLLRQQARWLPPLWGRHCRRKKWRLCRSLSQPWWWWWLCVCCPPGGAAASAAEMRQHSTDPLNHSIRIASTPRRLASDDFRQSSKCPAIVGTQANEDCNANANANGGCHDQVKIRRLSIYCSFSLFSIYSRICRV